ncbi:hypothetical protein, partial [Asanoa ferruginea]|uniref:hypothetical protein n=1 Tax=Asanoa ferruginea TaxID=53367 RepID=UPI0019416A86
VAGVVLSAWLTFMVFTPDAPDDAPRWTDFLMLPFVVVLLFVAIYFALTVVQFLLPAMFQDSGRASGAESRMDENATRLAAQRKATFDARYERQPPWQPPKR